MEPKKIIHNNQVLAIFFSKDIRTDGGIKFFTPDYYPLQIGLIEHKDGREVPPHIHRDLVYDVNTTQEFLYVEKGEGVKVKIFSNEWKEVEELEMNAGDSILFVGGGHSVDIPPDCRLFEVKQGPYPGDKQAKIFKTV